MEQVFDSNLAAAEADYDRVSTLVDHFRENALVRLVQREIALRIAKDKHVLRVLRFLQTVAKQSALAHSHNVQPVHHLTRNKALATPRGMWAEMGHVYAWGTGWYGQLGLGEETVWCRFPHLVRFPANVKVKQIVSGHHHVLALAGNGTLHSTPHPLPSLSLPFTRYHACVLPPLQRMAWCTLGAEASLGNWGMARPPRQTSSACAAARPANWA